MCQIVNFRVRPVADIVGGDFDGTEQSLNMGSVKHAEVSSVSPAIERSRIGNEDFSTTA